MIKTIMIITTLIILILILIFYRYKCNSNNYKVKYENSIKTLYRQSARWAIASIQDDSELIRILHANYATGYLWGLKDIISSQDFEKITGQNFLEFENKIVSIQDKATQLLVNKCQSLIENKDPILLSAIYSKA